MTSALGAGPLGGLTTGFVVSFGLTGYTPVVSVTDGPLIVLFAGAAFDVSVELLDEDDPHPGPHGREAQ